ncbi:MAG: DNA-binding response regulator [Planctomycetota bacterium]|nr:MAG: DNA-binding response regulator [Planctomycetota bacterium]
MKAKGKKILVVEDEAVLRMALVDALEAQGYEVEEAEDGESALAQLDRDDWDLWLLDLMLPGVQGLDVLQRLRQSHPRLPVMILTARGEEYDRVRGFECGADDYVLKPFSMRELLLRLEAILRRVPNPGPAENGKLRIGQATVDFAGYCLHRQDRQFELSRREMELLKFFLAHEGQVLSRNRLLDEVWGADAFPTTRTVDTHVFKLRRKLEGDADKPQLILTVHGVGYKFVHPTPDVPQQKIDK